MLAPSGSARTLLALVAACSPLVAADGPFLLGGIQVNEPDSERWVETLDRVGMNTVAVTVYAHQGDWSRDELWWNEDEPAVLDEIRAAKRRGLRVALILRVAVDHAVPANRFVWHGMIMPDSPPRIRSWFARYRSFNEKWAEIAEREGVDLFGIGSEMNALSATGTIDRWGLLRDYYAVIFYERRLRARTRRFADELERRHLWTRGYGDYPDVESFLADRFAHKKAWARRVYFKGQPGARRRVRERRALVLAEWRVLIDAVRARYGGALTYAANFDSYRAVAFWDRLDVIGINAYFSLRGSLERPSDVESYERRWSSIFRDIEAMRSERGLDRPVVFTELGYTFRRHSTVEPWAHDSYSVVGWGTKQRGLVVWSEQPIDYGERQRALEGLRRVREREALPLSGILWWKLSTFSEHEAIEPFVLHVGEDSADPLQPTLLRFLDDPARDRGADADASPADGRPPADAPAVGTGTGR